MTIAAAPTTIDPIRREVISAALRYVVREMRTTLIRSSYSPILYETHDLSCCLCTPDGQIASMHVDLPLHIFPVVFSVPHLNEKFGDDIRPGDVYITNDPWIAGAHLNDVQLLRPVFVDGELELLAAVRAHHGDVGGMTPGSISGASTEILHEGVRVPMLRIVRDGKRNESLVELMLANVRQPFETDGVLSGQIAVCKIAEQRIRTIYERFGREAVRSCVRSNLEYDAEVLARAIDELPDGEYFYEDYLENSGSSIENARPIYTRAAMTIAGDHVALDFSKSSPQRAGVGNAEIADTWCGVFTVFETMLNTGSVGTTGGVRQLDVVTTPGTVVDGQHPAPVTGFADVMTGPVQGSCVGLLSQVIPDRVCAPVSSTANQMIIGGPSNPKRGGNPWFVFEFSFGGWSAVKEHDGNLSGSQWWHGDIPHFWPIEGMELLNPLRLVVSDLLSDSGGPGRHRGGVGIQRAWEVLAPAYLSFLGSNGILPRPGTCLGGSGTLNALLVMRDGEVIVPGDVPLKVASFDLRVGDLVVLFTGGGGGFGDPLERPSDDVVQDVVDGYVTVEGARADYGVALVDDHIDEAATAALRAQVAARRVHVTSAEAPDDEFDADGCRIVRISSATAAGIGVASGDVVEFALAAGAGLRAWAQVDDRVPDGQATIGEIGRRITHTGGSVWLRTPWSYGSAAHRRDALLDTIRRLAGK